MATTAQALHNYNIAAADEMDLRSDTELDFGDGDIELDLAPPEPQDDDVSIQDAEEDMMSDFEDDQDDEMTDPDVGQEEQNVDHGTQDDQAPPNNLNATSEIAQEAEEDLIDYSDEEEEFDINAHIYEQAQKEADKRQLLYGTQEDEHTPGSASDTNRVPKHSTEDQSAVEYATHDDEEQQYAPEFDADREADAHTDVEDGGVQLQDPEAQTNNSEHDDAHENQSASEIRSITINYQGNDLWLFKQYDVDDSGDWFLEDVSLVHSSLKDLFAACRASLGEDMSHDTELGFRFDHLHNMEIFEDNMACVTVSLERLVELYHNLHAQDENHEPESFYMCLLSRPRFLTLLADVAKYAEQGSGFSGLAAAIAAGETNFADTLSGHSTEYDGEDWENEAVEQHDGVDLASGEEPKTEYTEHEEQGDGDESRDDHEEEQQTKEEEEHDQASTSENATHGVQVSQTENDSTAQDYDDRSEKSVHHDQTTEKTEQQGSPTAIELQQEQIDNDTVDYSDAEDQEDDEAPHTLTHDGLSPSSSTVQGDDSAATEISLHIAGSTKHEETHNDDQDGVDYDAENFDSTHPLTEEHGQEENTESYQDYTEAYDQEDPFEEHQTGASEAYPTEASFEDYTNQEYTGYEYQDLDQQLENDFITGADFDEASAGGSADAGIDLIGGDDFLDLENAPEWFVDEDSTSKVAVDVSTVDDVVNDTTQHEEEEYGVVEQPVVAASSAADPVAASSEDLQESPLQGQKRSIDEVGDSVGDALDLTDMKRPRV